MRLFLHPPCLQPGAYRFTVGMQDIHASLEADGEQLLGWRAGLHYRYMVNELRLQFCRAAGLPRAFCCQLVCPSSGLCWPLYAIAQCQRAAHFALCPTPTQAPLCTAALATEPSPSLHWWCCGSATRSARAATDGRRWVGGQASMRELERGTERANV